MNVPRVQPVLTLGPEVMRATIPISVVGDLPALHVSDGEKIIMVVLFPSIDGGRSINGKESQHYHRYKYPSAR